MIIPKNILIVRTDRIGDVVLSIPLAGIIKKSFPECRITFLLKEYTRPLAEGNPHIDEVLTLKEKYGKILFNENVDMLVKYKFDTSIVVYPTFITSLIIYFSNIKNRIGTGYRWYSFLFNYKMYEHRKYAQRHELEFNTNMLKLIGIDADVNRKIIKFDISSDVTMIDKIKRMLTSKGVDFSKPIIIVHPGSGGSAVDLPISKFRELVELISSKMDVNLILTGSAFEKEVCSQLETSNKVLNLAGEFDLNGLKALISLCSLFIANSTGPLHLAAALDKYVIGFYPKIKACSVERWGPYTEKSVIFSPEIDCADCTREQCLKLNCMNSIDVKNIFTEVEKIHKLVSN